MRIAHVIHGHPPRSMGGTGLYVHALAHALATVGHDVAVASPESNGRTRLIERDGGVEHWSIGTDRVRAWSDTWNGSVATWVDWCAQWRPDVVHIHHLSGWPLSLVEHTPCRTVLTLHDYAIPCARGQLLTAQLALCDGPSATACTRCLGPALRTHPVLHAIGQWVARAPRLYRLARQLASRAGSAADHPDVAARLEAANRAISAADHLLAPSRDLAERIARLGFAKPSHTELPLLHPPLPVPSTPTERASGPVRFLFASSILPTKGVDRLVACFERLSENATLTIAGHAPPFDGHPGFGASVRARAMALPNVTWVGAVESDAVPQLMRDHDVLVLPSIWPENSPLVVREATASGLRIIGPRLGGCAELAPDATLVGTEEELFFALVAESRARHPRAKPRSWPSPQAHASVLLRTAYR